MEHFLNLNFNPFPALNTQRLILRRIDSNDIQSFFEIRSNKELMLTLDKEPFKDINQTIDFLSLIDNGINANESIAWAVCLKTDNRMIGHIGFHKIDALNHRAEIGYALLPRFHNLGLGVESLKAILNIAFNQFNLYSIEADINPLNNPSINLVTKLGFVKEAHFKENYYFRNQFLDSAIYSLLKKNYLSALQKTVPRETINNNNLNIMNKIEVSVNVNKPIAIIWDYFTNPKHIVNWCFASPDWHAPLSENNLMVGGTFKTRMEAKDGSFGFDFTGEYTTVVLSKQLDYVLEDGRTASVLFTEVNNQTIITQFFDPESENSIELQQAGWQSILNNFKHYTELN